MMPFAIRLNQQATLILSTVLLLLLILTASLTSYYWYQDWQLTHQPMPSAPPLNTEDNSQIIEAIPQGHLFGKALEKRTEVPVSSLQLKVTGIATTTGDAALTHSKAYISTSGQPSKIYKVGDEVTYGVKIHDITPFAVILENNGKLEKLPLPRESLEFKLKQTKES